jgi:hypothetical protein
MSRICYLKLDKVCRGLAFGIRQIVGDDDLQNVLAGFDLAEVSGRRTNAPGLLIG